MSTPRTRGYFAAADRLNSAINDLNDLLKLDEFPLHKSELTRCRNILVAFRLIREEDRKAGHHKCGELHAFAPHPGR